MAFKLRDNVAETSTTTGSGDIDLAGAVTGYNSFGSFLSTGDTTWAQIRNVDVPTEWLSAVVEYVTGNDLEIITILDGTNGAGNAVSFSAGVKQVVCGMPAAEVLARQDILGTVSQSGGDPTGAIIERGSNANGNYSRWADGTQICFHAFPAVVINISGGGSLYTTADQTWTFPAAFASPPSVSGHSRRASSGTASPWLGGGLQSTSTLACAWRYWSTGNTVEGSADMLAIGRWF